MKKSKRKSRLWRGWAVVTRRGRELRYVSGDPQWKPVVQDSMRRVLRVAKIEIREVR